MRVALTGHRPQRLGLPDDETSDKWGRIIGWLSQQIIKIAEVSFIEDETVDLYCGMASGCDVTFGLVGTILKEGLDCKLHCILPCKNYNSYWYLTKLAAKCTAKRMNPDYISEKIMKKYKEGNCFPCMGERKLQPRINRLNLVA